MEYQKIISNRRFLECKYDEQGEEIVVNNWSKDVNSILDKIRINSILLSNEHKKSYFILSSKLKWFRIPMILLSSIGSIFNVGLPPYVGPSSVGIVCAIISLFVGLIGSLELFLAIGTKMESELIQSKELYLLAIEIQKTLLLDSLHRNGDGIAYLEDRFNMYSKLIENSQLLECRIIDELTPLPEEYIKKVLPNSHVFYANRRSGAKGEKVPRHRFSGLGLFPKRVAPQQESPVASNSDMIVIKSPKSPESKRAPNRKLQLSNHIANMKLDTIENGDAGSISFSGILVDQPSPLPPPQKASNKPSFSTVFQAPRKSSLSTYLPNTPYKDMKNVIISKDVYNESLPPENEEGGSGSGSGSGGNSTP